MQYVKLGNTNLNVSRLCFGGLTIGPLQANLSISKGAEVIKLALELGINFIDTAELYGTYSHIRAALKRTNKRAIIATKSYAYDKITAKKSFEEARKEMDVDVIDIFLLHEQESRLTLKGHKEALEYYLTEKQKGNIKAVGVSTHRIEVVSIAAEMQEIDVIHPIINRVGIGIGDGNIEQMLVAVRKANSAGKGIYGMKALGGGNLINSYNESMKFVLQNKDIHSIAMGMQSEKEVILNVSVFNDENLLNEKLDIDKTNKKLHIEFWCEGCGKCVNRCNHQALNIEEGKACIDTKKCVLCGYCASVCEKFAIKVC